MANCINCGKKIGMFEGSGKVNNSSDNIYCEKCYNLIYEYVKTIGSKNSSQDDFENAKKNILSIATDHKFSSKSISDIKEYIEYSQSCRERWISSLDEKTKQQLKRKELISKITDEQVSSHMITTGYNFENYSIISYLKVISGESVLGTGIISEISANISDLSGGESNAFSSKLMTARDNAIKRLIYNSIMCGGNAIIGVTFDYINFSGNMIGVIANGTSVVIEKCEKMNDIK